MGSELALVLGLLKVGLELWKDERSDKFQKQFLKLNKELDEEKLLGDKASDKRIDELERELRQLAESFVYASKRQ
jgi:predicted transcriptional regulator